MKKENRNEPFLNSTLPVEERLYDLLGRMTLEEKIGLLSTNQKAIPRLDIGEWHIGTEVARGFVSHDKDKPSTVFPQPIGMASMFHPELMYKVGEIAGTEARIYHKKQPGGGLMMWGPTVDMERDPRWGRTEEAYGEDPFLTGEMAIAYTKGLRGEDAFYMRTVPTLKHFYGNNNEKDRVSSSSSIMPRLKEEYYYAPFREIITKGGAYSMMAAYNEVGGVPAMVNPELRSIVKDKWGLGFLVTDGGDFSQTVLEHHYTKTHGETLALALKAGMDVMTDLPELVEAAAREALQKGLVIEADIDEAIYNSMKARFYLGEFDPIENNPYTHIDEKLLNCEAYKKVNLQVTKESIVLLKNEGVLPLVENAIKRVAVIGPQGELNCRDWYSGVSTYNISIVEGLKKALGAEKVLVDDGWDYVAIKSDVNSKFLTVEEGGMIWANGDVIGEKQTFKRLEWGDDIVNYKSLYTEGFLTTEKEEVTANTTDLFGWFIEESLKKEIRENGVVRFYTWNTWQHQELYITNRGQLKSTLSKDICESRFFREELISSGIQRAAELAKRADVAIVCVGNDPIQGAKECYDRENLNLPTHQSELIKAVQAVNPNMILLIVSSYPYAINWEKKNIPGILYMAHGGPEMGRAVSEVLLGKYNPAGRLPLTWYKSHLDLGDLMDYDIWHKKVTYLYYEREPLYPFGHGLSYSDFKYNNLISKVDEENSKEVLLEFDITNISNRDGEEVAQIYSTALASKIPRPLKVLCYFKRIFIKAKETVRIRANIPYERLAIWHLDKECFVVEEGIYKLMVGTSSSNIQLETTIGIQGEQIGVRKLSFYTKAVNCDDYHAVEIKFARALGGHYLNMETRLSWIKFSQVDLEEAKMLELSVAAPMGGSEVEVHLDTIEGPIAAKIQIASSASEESFSIISAKLEKVEGVHDIYIRSTKLLSLYKLRIF